MANEQNLIPIMQRTPEERKEIARKGAEATNKLKAERKTLKQELLLLLAQGDIQEKGCLAIIDKFTKGDIKAFETIRDTVGEKPVDKVEGSLITYENTLKAVDGDEY